MLAADPDELERHRVALQSARRRRRSQIADRTERLVSRIDAAASTANSQVLLHPIQSAAVIRSSNHVAGGVVDFNERLGIESSREILEATRWTAAAIALRDKMLETGSDGMDTAKRLGSKTLDDAKSTTDKLSKGLLQRMSRLRRGGPDEQDADAAQSEGPSHR